MFKRLRDELPIYYNAEHDFYALSRFEDVNAGLIDKDTFISGRGAILELIKANIEIPSGVLLFEDPPVHTFHRKLLSGCRCGPSACCSASRKRTRKPSAISPTSRCARRRASR